MGQRVHVFWDNSNIFIPARYAAFRQEGPYAEAQVRIHFDNLLNLALAGRQLADGICVGSLPPDQQMLWNRLRSTGIRVELYERGTESRREQGVDQCLQIHMLRTAMDVSSPQVVVLLTGDGAGYAEGTGFWADLKRMQSQGWGVEVLSWDIACNRGLKDWATKNGAYVRLEDYYQSITFLEHGRRARPLNLTHRPKAYPAVGQAA